MADEGFDICEYIWSSELAMRHLLSIMDSRNKGHCTIVKRILKSLKQKISSGELRQNQNYCTDNECFNMSQLPGPQGVPPSSNFLMTCMIIAFVVIMYVLRPNSLRRVKNDVVKDRHNEHDSNGGPPAPPPTAQ